MINQENSVIVEVTTAAYVKIYLVMLFVTGSHAIFKPESGETPWSRTEDENKTLAHGTNFIFFKVNNNEKTKLHFIFWKVNDKPNYILFFEKLTTMKRTKLHM